jgi:hypothetical protein
MMIQVAENGAEYEEPPHTEAEEEEFYWRISHGVVQVTHGGRTIVPQPPRPPKSDPRESKSQSSTQASEK